MPSVRVGDEPVLVEFLITRKQKVLSNSEIVISLILEQMVGIGILDEQKKPHVILRCTVCKHKYDSKYDHMPFAETFKLGETRKNFAFCPKCKRRTDAQVFSIR